MSQSPIEKAIAAGAEWMEANKNHPDVEAFACVASAMADLSRVANGDKKETAGDAAVEKMVQNDLLEILDTKFILRDETNLNCAAKGILNVLSTYGINHKEIDGVFDLVKFAVSHQIISVSAHTAQ